DADHERSGEAGSARDRDGVEVFEAHLRFGERSLNGRLQRLEVRTGSDLWHDAAVAGVLIHAGGDRVRQQRAPADDADTGFVAACLYAEHEGFRRHSFTFITIAS